MKVIHNMMVQVIDYSQSTIGFNLPLLVITVAVLLLALTVCIHISRKNKLYIKFDSQEPLISSEFKENEVVS